MRVEFCDLIARWAWRPIPNCPGRLVFSDGPTSLSPEELALSPMGVTEHIVATANDPVVVAIFGDGGLISYRKPNGTYVHTLNSRDGLVRKLQQLGINVADGDCQPTEPGEILDRCLTKPST